jgi:hypothetical protein
MSRSPIFPLAIQPGDNFQWHNYAHAENSSQAFCLSALASLRDPAFDAVRQRVLASLVGEAFPHWPKDALEGWKIEVEKQAPGLLNEIGGGTPSSLDALLTTPRTVVAVESKFAVDANAGFGGCGQYHGRKHRKCAGFHGAGSDLVQHTQVTAAACRLTIPDGTRTPRWYWDLGRRWFRAEVFAEQMDSEICPFRDSNFQLMRNFLFAAAHAEQQGKEHFGVLVLCSQRRDQKLIGQVKVFQTEILQDSHRSQVAVVHYERLIGLLSASSATAAHDLAAFLTESINKVLPSPILRSSD